MSQLRFVTLLSGFCIALTAWAACATPPANHRPQPPRAVGLETAEPAGPVALNVAMDKKTYAVGQPIQVTLTARNTTKAPVSLAFSSGQRYDLTIHRGARGEGPQVYQWSRGMMFSMMVSSKTLDPGKTLTFAVMIPTKNGAGRSFAPLTPGTYRLDAVLTTMPRTARPQTHMTLTVK